MLYKQSIRLFSVLSMIFTCLSGYSYTVYTTSLNVKKSEQTVLIEWKANTNRFTYWIYRSTNGPIAFPSDLTKADKIATLELDGKPDKDLFKYAPYRDTIGTVGQYYYIVLPAKTEWTGEDFNPNLNFTISPVTFRTIEPVAAIPDTEPTDASDEDEPDETQGTNPLSAPPVSQPQILNPAFIRGIFIRTNMGFFQVFWDAGSDGSQPPASRSFYVYRTTNYISNVVQFARLKPYKIVQDDFVLEDTDVRYGVPYFYTILVNDYKIILPGVNENLSPAFWGSTNGKDIPVEREIIRREKVNTRSYQNRFRK